MEKVRRWGSLYLLRIYGFSAIRPAKSANKRLVELRCEIFCKERKDVAAHNLKRKAWESVRLQTLLANSWRAKRIINEKSFTTFMMLWKLNGTENTTVSFISISVCDRINVDPTDG